VSQHIAAKSPALAAFDRPTRCAASGDNITADMQDRNLNGQVAQQLNPRSAAKSEIDRVTSPITMIEHGPCAAHRYSR
jgi:hypothetical protein